MANGVETPQISIDPFRSQVPLVQIPQQDLQGPPQQGGIYSKAGGIATLADGAMKGLLRGLQLKEQKKYETASAVMNAQDAGIAAAKKNYDDMLTTKGAFEEDGKTPKAETQAAYSAWQQAVNAAAAQRQAFAIPDQKPKGSKDSKKKDKNQPDQVPAGGGFAAGLKQFFERNPHIVPELAIIGMKAQVTPYGQMAPEQQKQKMEMDAAQRQEANQKVIDAARGTYDKYAGKSGLTPVQQEELNNAEAVLRPITSQTKYQVLVDPQGQQHTYPIGTEILDGWKVYEKPSASQTPRAGTEQEFTSQALKGYGYTNDTAPPGLLKYLHDTWQYRQPQSSSATSGSTVDVNGNRTSTTQTTRGGTAPKPPAGFSPLGEDGQPLKEVKTGKMTAPPKPGGEPAAAAPKAGRGAMTAPPAADGKPTLTSANRTMKVETEEKGMYDKATAAYQKALQTNKAKAPDKASLDAANAQAEQAYTAAKAQIVLWKASQVKAIGGDPWKAQGKAADGKLYGTMDGTNWVNVETGYPYTEQ